MLKKICNLLIELGIISLIIFPPIAFGAVQFRHITYIHLIILFISLIWIIKVFVKGSFTYIPTPFDLPILLFLGLGVVNLFTSTYRHNSERELYLFLNYALLYFLVVQQLKTVRRIVGLAFIIILIGSGESLFGLFQYLQGAKTVLGYQTPNIGTVNATYFSHNHFAGFLILIIPIALGLFVGTANLEKKFFVSLLLGLTSAALVLTLSRGGLLSIFVASGFFVVCFIFKNRRKTASWRKYLVLLLLLVFCIAGYVAWIGVSPIAHRSLFETFFPTKEAFEQEMRFSLWSNALALVKEFPVFGSGLGTFEYVFLRYRLENSPQHLQAFHAHNDYLELLIEIGIPALLLTLWTIFRFYRYGFRGYFRRTDPVLTSLVLGGLTSCTAMFIHSFFDFNLQIPANALLFFIVLALTMATIQLMTRGRAKTRNGSSSQKQAAYHIKVSWIFLLIAVGVIGILVGNFRTNVALTYYSKAKTFQLQYQPLPAIEWYQKAITFDGSDALFHEALGASYRHLGKSTPHSEKWYQLAVQKFQDAIALNAYNPEYYFQLGLTYAALNMEQEAIGAFQNAIVYNPRISFYYENLGSYYLSLEQLAPAMEAYRKAAELDPKRIEPLLNVCKKYNLDYDEYQALIPEDAESRRFFASLLAQQESWKESKVEYRKAIELSGKQQEYYDAMLNACNTQRDYQCMRTLWQELWEQDHSDPVFLVKIAESFATQQMWDQAINHYQKLLQDRPDHVQGHQRLAQLYQQLGRSNEALQVYEKLLAIRRDDAASYHNIAAVYRQKNDWNAAIKVYKKAIESGLTQAEIYSNLGELYLQNGNEKKGLKALEQALHVGETRMSIYKQLEQLYQTQNNGIALELLWETYMLANKQNPKALFQLAHHYHANGEWLKAVTLSKEIITYTPTNVVYRQYLANLYEQKKMLHESIEQWEKIVRMHSGDIEHKLHLAVLYETVNQWDNAKTQYRSVLRIQPDNQHAKQKLSRFQMAN